MVPFTPEGKLLRNGSMIRKCDIEANVDECDLV